MGQTLCNPSQGSNETLPVILWHVHSDPSPTPAVTVSYKTLILSTQFNQDKVHRSDSRDCNPPQSSSESVPVFSLQCFHRNGWNHSGVRNCNTFHSVLLRTGMGGKLETPSSCTARFVSSHSISTHLLKNIVSRFPLSFIFP